MEQELAATEEKPAALTAEDLEKTRQEILGKFSEVSESLVRERQAREGLETQLREQKAAPRRRSAEELQQLVDQGILTDSQRNDELLRQGREDMKEELRAELRQEAQNLSRGQTIAKRIEKYTDAIPEIRTAGSPERTKVEAEYRTLVSEFGQPESTATELLALRKVFGEEPRKIAERTGERPPSAQETEQGGSRGAKKPNADGAPVGLSPRLKEHYEKMFEKGYYPGGWKDKDVIDELSRVR